MDYGKNQPARWDRVERPEGHAQHMVGPTSNNLVWDQDKATRKTDSR